MSLLPEKDEQYLKEKQLNYELKQVGSEVHLIIHAWEFPEAYSPRTADVLIRISPAYPMSRLDMFYTIPTIMLKSGAWPVKCQVMEALDGRTWQRWSRHHDWRAGVDNLRSFITAMTAEINKGI